MTGLLLGTVGMVPEWGWTQLWSPQPWQPRLLGSWWAVVATAVVASFLGSALGRAVSHAPQVVHFSGVAVAFALMLLLLAVPFPRGGLGATATISGARVGQPSPVATRDGVAALEQDMTFSVRVSPSNALDGADLFRLSTWQGGRLIISPLHRVGGGRYAMDGTVPTGGSWKTIVFLEKGDVVAAVPVSFPTDPTYGLAAIPAPVSSPRTSPFNPASQYLMRESHAGSALPAVLAYTALALIFVVWCVAVVGVGEAMRRRRTVRVTLPSVLGG